MKKCNTEIEGVYILKNFNSKDLRGSFTKVYNKEDFLELNSMIDINEVYYSISNRNVIRGLHFQLPPYEHDKLVTVIQGSVQDVIVDLRKNSATYGKYMIYNLTDNDKAILIPKGCAHGFKSMEEHTIMMYMVSTVYNKEYDSGIKWDSIGLDWKIENPIVSEKDNNLTRLEYFKSPF